VGAASTKSGRFSTAGWAGPGERDGKVYARNRCHYAFLTQRQLEPVDVGWSAVRTHPQGGELLVGIARLGWEAAVKVYGVAVARPQG
jgi:hypothetical protein